MVIEQLGRKMDFKARYIQGMRNKAPKLFMELRRKGLMDQFLQERSVEAHRLLGEIKNGDNLASEREAEEQVSAVMLDFPVPGSLHTTGRRKSSVPPTTASRIR
jgi:hypothetical protein